LAQLIQQAINSGVSAETIALVLLFPLFAGLIAAARHLLGLTGFGIFVPGLLAAAFTVTGLKSGLILLVIIWLSAWFGRKLTKKLKLQYLPRLALVIWLAAVAVLTLLLSGTAAAAVAAIPVLILLVSAEHFLEVLTGKSRHEAGRILLQTLAASASGAVLLRSSVIQGLTLQYPEICLLAAAGLNIFTGRYTGLRLLEMWKFRKLIK